MKNKFRLNDNAGFPPSVIGAITAPTSTTDGSGDVFHPVDLSKKKKRKRHKNLKYIINYDEYKRSKK